MSLVSPPQSLQLNLPHSRDHVIARACADVLLQLEADSVVGLVYIKQVPAGAAMGTVDIDPWPSAAIVADITGRHIQRNNHVVLLKQITEDTNLEILQQMEIQPALHTKNLIYNCIGLFTTHN